MKDGESGKDHVNATQRQLVQSQAEAGPPLLSWPGGCTEAFG